MKRWAWVVFWTFLISWFYYFPPHFTFSDEGQYLHTTWLVSQGISPRVADPSLSFSYSTKDYEVFFPQYPIGQSILLLPFAAFGWKLIFLAGIIFHLVTFFFFRKLLQKEGIDPAWALIYLLYPGLVFFSRTIMSELASVMFIFIGYYYYRQESSYLSGLFFGFSLFIRYTNIIYIAPFFFIAFFQKPRQKFNQMALAILPSLVILGIYNYAVYGGIFATGTKSPRGFSLLLMGKYILSLLVMYPLILLAPFKKKESEISLAVLSGIFIFSYSGIDTFHYDLFKNLIIGYRYLFPIIPLLLFSYVVWIHKKRISAILPAGCFILLVLTVTMMHMQFIFSAANRDIMERIYTETKDGFLILANGYVTSMYVNNFFGERKAFAITTYESKTENTGPVTGNELIEIRLAHAKRLLADTSAYLVFAESGTVTNDIKPTEASSAEVGDEREGERNIAKRLNATLIYAQDTPDYIQVWKVPRSVGSSSPADLKT